jgi:phospholipid/cholesterol/gamma-HCH transport system substrate-binding protein
MTFGKSKLELKVGVFVFIGLILLSVFVLVVGDFKTMVSTQKINFVFNFINGVKNGAPIRYAGVDIGEVKQISLFYSPVEKKEKVLVAGVIKKDVRIPQDSSIWVNTLGLLGEKYIDIMPGHDYTDFIKPGQTVVGTDPFAMHEFGELAKSIAKKLDDSIVEVQQLAGSVSSLAKNLDDGISKVKNAEGTIGKLLYDDKLYNDLSDMVGDIKRNPWKLFWKAKEKPAPKPEPAKK